MTSFEWCRCCFVALLLLGAQASPAASDSQLSDLPLIEVLPKDFTAPTAKDRGGNSFALLLTGVGGWVRIDRVVSAELAANGIPVVGFNTVKYFWAARTPEESARDVARVMEHYMHRWSRSRVVLIGYSLGADALPSIVNRLPGEFRDHVSEVVLIGLGDTAVFEVDVTIWLPIPLKGDPVAPELDALVDKIDRSRVLCLYGAGERESLCPRLARAGARTEQIGTGHHLGGRYVEIARRIVELNATVR